MLMKTLMRSRKQTSAMMLAGRSQHNFFDPKDQVPFESTRISNLSRFRDEPEPKENEQIVGHYLKHHPLYEFRNLEEFHVDGYRHWLHARAEYYNTETYPAEVSPWEQGSKLGHLVFLLFPLFAYFVIGNAYKSHCKQKNVKMPIVGVFSQCQV